MKSFNLGKYKGIMVSVALFLLLDASVLMLNFYISFEISEDAVGVNTAGRQRMLSQRMMKALLNTDVSTSAPEISLAELRNTSNLFDKTLAAFANGGETPGADGTPVILKPVGSKDSLDAIAQTQLIWAPYKKHIETLLAINFEENNFEFEAALATAIKYGNANNLKMLQLMNKLTVDLESVASSKATRLRIIQTVGISLAIVNFFIIMFHFLRQLRSSDEKIEAARQETQEILETVNEGLFLIDEDLIIGEQHSTELENIFGRTDIAGHSFQSLLKDIVSEKDMNTTQSFIKLLFKPTVKQKLIGDLNPLNEVEIHLPLEEGGYLSKFLSFSFSRVITDSLISHVLVTVKDITEQIQLARELDTARSQNEKQLELLSALLNTNSDLLPMFLSNSFKTFNEINMSLRNPAKNQSQYLAKANRIYALIHNFKGEASALNLDQFVETAHQFEDAIAELKNKKQINGKDFLSLTVMLNGLIAQTESAGGLAEKLKRFTNISKTTAQEAPAPMDWSHLDTLTQQVAQKQKKSVNLIHSGLNDNGIDKTLHSLINSISIQLIRNAVSHGIETPNERKLAQKTSIGEIDIRLAKRSDGNYVYTFKDDGNGIDTNSIRDAAIKRGIITERQADIMSKKQLISLIFSPELSTKTEVDTDAGRGIGMHSVRELIQQLGGKIAIASRNGYGCTFTISFPQNASLKDAV